MLRNRDDIAGWLNGQNLLNVAVEIGTDRGAFARDFLRQWRGACLYCVDPWQTDLPGYADLICWNREPDYHTAIAALAPYCDRVRILRHTSAEAARMIPGQVDFVYIDANHAHDAVAADIELWWPRIRPGGVLAGHDWDEEHDGVRQAVTAFKKARGVTVMLTGEERYKSWLVRKSL